MASINICLGFDCEALTTNGAVYCAACQRADHAAHIAMVDVFQRATSGYHTLSHVGWTAERLGTGPSTPDLWHRFQEWNPEVIRIHIPQQRTRCRNAL